MVRRNLRRTDRHRVLVSADHGGFAVDSYDNYHAADCNSVDNLVLAIDTVVVGAGLADHYSSVQDSLLRNNHVDHN